MTLRWGIIGPGRIARKLAADFAVVDGCELVAVGSRDPARAKAFVAGLPPAPAEPVRPYGSYADLLADPGVDVVYIATPHRQHAAIAVAALTAGKAVLVEKAFTCTVSGAQTVMDTAKAHRLFAMEAMWTRFVPLVVRLRELLADGVIGEVRSVHADLGVTHEFDPADRLWDPAQGGGALLDLGVYPVAFAQMILGEPGSVEVHGNLGRTGVDEDVALLLGYDSGAWAMLDCSLRLPLAGAASVIGSAGRIDVLPRFHHPVDMVLRRTGHDPTPVGLPMLAGGYAHQLIEVRDRIAAGHLESAVMPLRDTLSVLRTLETALRRLGLQLTEDADAMR
jgi:predicted dehydrogenase